MPGHLAKARLIPLKGKSSSQKNQQAGAAESPEQGGFTVLFNPTTLKVTYSNTLEGSNARGSKQRQYIGRQSTEMSVDLIFDTTDLVPGQEPPWGDDESKRKARAAQDEVDVRIFTSRIVAMLDKADANSPKPAPVRVQFAWGSFLFEGVMKSLTETLDLFSADGIPLRATLAFALSEDNLEFKTASSEAQQPPVAVTNSGDTAAQLAANNNLPPQAGKAIAAANNLDDVRSLPSGAALQLSAGAGLGASASLGASAGASFGASASASFGVSAGAGLSASASADVSGGFGGGGGLGVSLGGGGGFGLDAGAGGGGGLSLGAGGGLSVGGGIGFGASAGGGAAFGASASFGASVGLNLSVSGGVAGAVAGVGSAALSIGAGGAVGGPSAGGAPGAQTVMDPSGGLTLAPAAPPRALPPPSSTPAGAAATTRTAPPPPVPAPTDASLAPTAALGTPARAAASGGTRLAGSIGLASSPAVGSLGLPPPLPPTSAPRGAFKGITGVPMKSLRFSASTPPPAPLAYRRLPPESSCLEMGGPCDVTAAPAAAPKPQKKGCGCGCGH